MINSWLIDKAENWKELTFKEVASLISATHKYVEVYDAKIIEQLNLETICLDCIKEELSSNNEFKRNYYFFKQKRKEAMILTFLNIKIWINKEDDYEKIKSCFSIPKD